uniref:Uncharacterized protein n=1 Tax=Romanomermis culicivorax TaxID=13658 RepID=A0A915JRX9_ROMCU
MVNLKYFRLNQERFHSNDTQKIGKLRKLKFLRWSGKDAAAFKIISFNSSLEGVHLYLNEYSSPASFDLILDQCPNLRYFSVDILNAEQIRKLPLRAPNRQYF